MRDAFPLAWLQAGSEPSAQPSDTARRVPVRWPSLQASPGGPPASFISHDDILAFDASACLVFEWA